MANAWGAEVPVRCALDRRGREGVTVAVESQRPAHLPPGSSVTHAWCAVDKGRALRCAMEASVPGRAPVRFDLFYQVI